MASPASVVNLVKNSLPVGVDPNSCTGKFWDALKQDERVSIIEVRSVNQFSDPLAGNNRAQEIEIVAVLDFPPGLGVHRNYCFAAASDAGFAAEYRKEGQAHFSLEQEGLRDNPYNKHDRVCCLESIGTVTTSREIAFSDSSAAEELRERITSESKIDFIWRSVTLHLFSDGRSARDYQSSRDTFAARLSAPV